MIRWQNNKGTALVLALVFAVVLLQLALAYSSMTRNTMPQTVQIDERIKLDHLAQGINELAVLKFQLFQADYYAAWEAAGLGNRQFLNDFTINAPEFTINNFTVSSSSFNAAPIGMQLASMALVTDNRWRNEALYIRSIAEYEDQFNRTVSRDAVRILSVDKVSLADF